MLTDLECRRAKPRKKDYALADARGLYLAISTTGGKRGRPEMTALRNYVEFCANLYRQVFNKHGRAVVAYPVGPTNIELKGDAADFIVACVDMVNSWAMGGTRRLDLDGNYYHVIQGFLVKTGTILGVQ